MLTTNSKVFKHECGTKNKNLWSSHLLQHLLNKQTNKHMFAQEADTGQPQMGPGCCAAVILALALCRQLPQERATHSDVY